MNCAHGMRVSALRCAMRHLGRVPAIEGQIKSDFRPIRRRTTCAQGVRGHAFIARSSLSAPDGSW
jgi:hypothetical protein